MSSDAPRGRPKNPDGTMETISVRLPADVYDVLCSSAQASRETLAVFIRGVLGRYAQHEKKFSLKTRKRPPVAPAIDELS